MAETDQWSDVEVPEPFTRFYRAEYSAIVALVYGLSGSQGAAEDIAQEAFLRAYRDWSRVQSMDSPQGWIRRVAMNLARSRWRRLKVEMTVRSRLSPQTVFSPPDGPTSEFWDEVRHLPRRQAEAVTLRYVEDLTVAEISEILQIAEGSVRALLFQGRERLRRQLVAKGLVDDEV
jgi:RNA polymerase sigma-70 factor (ECF subfamily)